LLEAIRTINCSISTDVRGRPALRALLPSGDQRPVPTNQRVRGYDRSDIEKRLTADLLGLDGQPSSLGVSEEQALVTEVLPKNPVLFLQILDHILLTAIHPAGQGCQEKRNGSVLTGWTVSYPGWKPTESRRGGRSQQIAIQPVRAG
jgi:hypothetical protein